MLISLLQHPYSFSLLFFFFLHAVSLTSVYPYLLAYVLILFAGGGTDSLVSRWDDSGVVDCAGNHRHDPLILIAIP